MSDLEFEKCKNNYEYFFDNYIKKVIPHKCPTIQVKLTKAQKEVFCHLNTPEKPITLFIKSRQMGYTTVMLSYCMWRATFYNETPILVTLYGCTDYFTKYWYMREGIPKAWRSKTENIKIFTWANFVEARKRRRIKYDKLLIEEVVGQTSDFDKEIEDIIFEDTLQGKSIFIGMIAGGSDFLQYLANFGTRDVGRFSIHVTSCDIFKSGLVKLENIPHISDESFQKEYMCKVPTDD